jgi:hypothetical protein
MLLGCAVRRWFLSLVVDASLRTQKKLASTVYVLYQRSLYYSTYTDNYATARHSNACPTSHPKIVRLPCGRDRYALSTVLYHTVERESILRTYMIYTRYSVYSYHTCSRTVHDTVIQ